MDEVEFPAGNRETQARRALSVLLDDLPDSLYDLAIQYLAAQRETGTSYEELLKRFLRRLGH